MLLIEVLLVRKKPCSEAYSRKASLMLRVNHNTSIQIKLLILPLKKIVEKIVNYSLPPRRNPPLDTLDTWISDTRDPTDPNTKKTICFVSFSYWVMTHWIQGNNRIPTITRIIWITHFLFISCLDQFGYTSRNPVTMGLRANTTDKIRNLHT